MWRRGVDRSRLPAHRQHPAAHAALHVTGAEDNSHTRMYIELHEFACLSGLLAGMNGRLGLSLQAALQIVHPLWLLRFSLMSSWPGKCEVQFIGVFVLPS
jgi:hypothetical protein